MMLKAGKLLMIDIGHYSDHSVIGFFVVLEDFDPMKIAAEFLAAEPEERDYSYNLYDKFVAQLIKRGLLLEIEYNNLFLGSGNGWMSLEEICVSGPISRNDWNGESP